MPLSAPSLRARLPEVVRRLAAVLALVSALLHVMMLGDGSLVAGVLIAAMAVVCFPCAGHLWRESSPRTWTALATMNALMLGLHVWLLLQGGHGSHGPGEDSAAVGVEHGHHGLPLSHLPLDHESLLMTASVVAAAEVVLAAAALMCGRVSRGLREVSRPETDRSYA
ncbi:hypothetical protein [Nesterenkonia flava]|uniref:hypothetical protein n=1 Tax=Nesterenkonia flava TaxID=469799 RepID=UPI00286E59AE|nr:hypothetical protein [Nesterenkonia flava]